MLALVPKVFTHGTSGVGCQVLKGCRIGGTGGDDGGVFHGPFPFENGGHLGNGGFFLAAGHVDTIYVSILLGQNGVDGHRGLANLTVADDQFALALAHGGHGVYRLESCVAGFVHRFSGDDTGSHHFHATVLRGVDGTLAVDGLAHA